MKSYAAQVAAERSTLDLGAICARVLDSLAASPGAR